MSMVTESIWSWLCVTFESNIDKLCMQEYDQELIDGIRWLDIQAQKEGVTFYDKVFEVLIKAETKRKAKEWLDNK